MMKTEPVQLTEARDPSEGIEVGAILGWKRVRYRDWLEALLKTLSPARRLEIRSDQEGRVSLWEYLTR